MAVIRGQWTSHFVDSIARRADAEQRSVFDRCGIGPQAKMAAENLGTNALGKERQIAGSMTKLSRSLPKEFGPWPSAIRTKQKNDDKQQGSRCSMNRLAEEVQRDSSIAFPAFP